METENSIDAADSSSQLNLVVPTGLAEAQIPREEGSTGPPSEQAASSDTNNEQRQLNS